MFLNEQAYDSLKLVNERKEASRVHSVVGEKIHTSQSVFALVLSQW